MSNVLDAVIFATRAHGGHLRKYTNEPYILHPLAVAKILEEVTKYEDAIIAAILHDVLEDTSVKVEDINKEFGVRVGSLVLAVTDVSKPEDGNREARKQIDREHMRYASIAAKNIKLADLIDNTSTIVEHDPEFAKIYMQEKRELLKLLSDGDESLFDTAMDQVVNYFNHLGEQ
jgi:(p)ppGpp synthase/HD superfamily hydrolase